MKGSMRKLAVAAVAACATLGVTLGTASAHKVKHRTSTAMDYLPPEPEFPTHDFVGVIHSKKGACEPRRKVVLLHNGVPVGRGTSTRIPEIDRGRDAWYGFTSGELEPPPGTYRAKVQRKRLRWNARHRHVCKPARSNRVRLAASAARARSADPLRGLFSASEPTRLR